MKYRFLGAVSEIGGVAALDSLGQKVNLQPEQALDAMKGGCVILPDGEYAKLGITADEEKTFRYPGARTNAPAEFKAKLAKGVARWQQFIDDDAWGVAPEVIEKLSVKTSPAPVFTPAASAEKETN